MHKLSYSGNHSQIGGGSGVEKLINTLAYGWVEHCNDIASCGTSYSQDNYSLCI